MRRFTLGAAMTVWLSFLPGIDKANATVLLATFSGSIEYGIDGDGLFGAPGSDLRGKTIVARFRIDTKAPNTTLREGTTYSDIVSGPLFNMTGNAVSGTVTINGYMQVAASDYGSDAVQRDEVSQGGNDLFGVSLYGSHSQDFGQRLDADVSSEASRVLRRLLLVRGSQHDEDDEQVFT